MQQKQCNDVRPDSRFWSHTTKFEVVSSLALYLFASRQTAPQVTICYSRKGGSNYAAALAALLRRLSGGPIVPIHVAVR